MKFTVYISLLITIFMISSCGIFHGSRHEKNNLTDKSRFEFDYAFFEAEKQKMLGNFDDAAMLFDKCRSIRPNSAVVYYELATIFIQKEQYTEAVSYAKTAVRLNPGNIWYKALLGVLYKQIGELNDAVSVYKDLVRQNNNRVDFLYEQATLYTKMKKYEEAVKVYDIIENKYGINEYVSLEKERIYYILGRREKAHNEINKLIAHNPGDIRYLGMLAESHINEGNFGEARNVYGKMLQADSTNGLVRLSLADFYRITKEYDKSFEQLKLAFASKDVEIDIKIKMLISFLTYSYDNYELRNQAFTLLEILLDTYPEDVKVLTLYADFLIRDNKPAEAREQLRLVIKTEKGKYLIWEQLLLLEIDLNDYDNMLAESKEALEYFPNQPLLYYFNGFANIKKGNNEDAVKSLKNGLNYVLDDLSLKANMYSLLAETYHKTEKMKESDEAMEQVLKIDKDNKAILNNYSYYLSLRGDSLDKAERMSMVCVELEPMNPTFLDTYAWVLYKQKKYDKALVIIEKAYNYGGSGNPVIIEHYGDILFRLGNTGKALEMWNEAFKLGKGTEFLEKKVNQKTLIE